MPEGKAGIQYRDYRLVKVLCAYGTIDFGARFRRADGFISFASPKETNQRKRAPGAHRSPMPSRGVSQTMKLFVSLRASVRLDGI